MKRLMKFASTILLLGMFAVLMASCNTIEGAGKDIERGGEEIQDVAD